MSKKVYMLKIEDKMIDVKGQPLRLEPHLIMEVRRGGCVGEFVAEASIPLSEIGEALRRLDK